MSSNIIGDVVTASIESKYRPRMLDLTKDGQRVVSLACGMSHFLTLAETDLGDDDNDDDIGGYRAAVNADGPVGYWRFQDSSTSRSVFNSGKVCQNINARKTLLLVSFYE
jgi:hypothetical protein